MKSYYSGVIVPMISPFTTQGVIDELAVAQVVEHLVKFHVSGIFALGTTGESASIPKNEKRRLIASTVESVNRRAVVYAGISDCCLKEAIEAAQLYKDLGVDALVAHPPYYYRTTNDGQIEDYYIHLANSVDLPLILYNMPATTNITISIGSVDRLRRHHNIHAIKDSDGSGSRISDLLTCVSTKTAFPVLLGSQSSYAAGLRTGAAGIVPSGAHIVPEIFQGMYEASVRRDWAEVDRLHQLATIACRAYMFDGCGQKLSICQSIAALKAILAKKGLCTPTVLSPLTEFRPYLDPTSPIAA